MKITTAPERIYLVACDTPDCDTPFHEHDEVTWCQDNINDYDVEYIRADLAAQPVAVPEGWKLVPVEPTLEMIAALGWYGDEILAMGHALISSEVAISYKAMLASAPKPEQQVCAGHKRPEHTVIGQLQRHHAHIAQTDNTGADSEAILQEVPELTDDEIMNLQYMAGGFDALRWARLVIAADRAKRS